MPQDDEAPEKLFGVRVVISSLGNERRNIDLGNENTEEQVQEVLRTINAAFGTIRASQALMLTGKDGNIFFANLDNVAFVEVQVGTA